MDNIQASNENVTGKKALVVIMIAFALYTLTMPWIKLNGYSQSDFFSGMRDDVSSMIDRFGVGDNPLAEAYDDLADASRAFDDGGLSPLEISRLERPIRKMADRVKQADEYIDEYDEESDDYEDGYDEDYEDGYEDDYDEDYGYYDDYDDYDSYDGYEDEYEDDYAGSYDDENYELTGAGDYEIRTVASQATTNMENISGFMMIFKFLFYLTLFVGAIAILRVLMLTPGKQKYGGGYFLFMMCLIAIMNLIIMMIVNDESDKVYNTLSGYIGAEGYDNGLHISATIWMLLGCLASIPLKFHWAAQTESASAGKSGNTPEDDKSEDEPKDESPKADKAESGDKAKALPDNDKEDSKEQPDDTDKKTGICPYCGAELDEDAKFCIRCGYKLDQEVAQTAAKPEESKLDEISITPEEQKAGCRKSLVVDGKKMAVKLPAGIRSGATISIKGAGKKFRVVVKDEQ